MTDDSTGGGSTATITDGFGFGGSTTNVQPTSEPPVKVEDSTPQKEDGQVSAKPEKPEEQPEKPKEQILEKKAEKSHTLIVDMLEEKFQQLKEGGVKDSELKDWFSKHPDLADRANRSKRVKEDFRALMDKEIPATESEAPAESKPITLQDLQRYDEERETKILVKAMQRERENLISDFASKHNVVDKDVDSLKRNAEALYKANPDWEYADAVAGSYAILNPRKGSPTNFSVPTGGGTKAPEATSSKLDVSGGVQLMSASEFSGGQLK